MDKLTIRQRRLLKDYEALKELKNRCLTIDHTSQNLPRFEFNHNGDIDAEEYPDKYEITLRIAGIRSPRKERSYEHICRIFLPANYPTTPPRVIWQTPIFHPNISTFDETNKLYRDLLEELGSEEAVIQQVNDNLDLAQQVEGYVCLDALKENWSPFIGLETIVVELANMVRYQTYTAVHPLNEVAGKWAREEEEFRHSFPLDKGLIEPKEVVIEIKL